MFSRAEPSYPTSQVAKEVGTAVGITYIDAAAGILALNLKITFTPPSSYYVLVGPLLAGADAQIFGHWTIFGNELTG